MKEVIQLFIQLALVGLIAGFLIKFGIPWLVAAGRRRDRMWRRLLSGRGIFDDDAPPPRREDGPWGPHPE